MGSADPEPVQDERPIVLQQFGDALRRREPRDEGTSAGWVRANRHKRGRIRQMKAEFSRGKERQFKVAVCHPSQAPQGQTAPLATRLGGSFALPGRALGGARH